MNIIDKILWYLNNKIPDMNQEQLERLASVAESDTEKDLYHAISKMMIFASYANNLSWLITAILIDPALKKIDFRYAIHSAR